MAESKLSEIEQKKKELELELSRIQTDLDQSIDEVKDEVVQSMDPKEIIRKHPLPVVGASMLVGFLLGSKSKRGSSSAKSSGDDSMGSAIGYELKRALMKKGVGLLLDFLDGKVDEVRNNITDSK